MAAVPFPKPEVVLSYLWIDSGAVDIIRYYIRRLELMKLIFAILDVSLTMDLTCCVQDVPVRCLTERQNYYSQCVW